MPCQEAKPLMKSLPEVKIDENLPKKTESKICFARIGLLETPLFQIGNFQYALLIYHMAGELRSTIQNIRAIIFTTKNRNDSRLYSHYTHVFNVFRLAAVVY